MHVLVVISFICLLPCRLCWAPFWKVHRLDPYCCLLPISHSPDLCPCCLWLLLQLPLLCRIFSSSFLFPCLRPVISELPMLPNIWPIFLWLPCLLHLSTGQILFADLPPLFCVSNRVPFPCLWGALLAIFWVWCRAWCLCGSQVLVESWRCVGKCHKWRCGTCGCGRLVLFGWRRSSRTGHNWRLLVFWWPLLVCIAVACG